MSKNTDKLDAIKRMLPAVPSKWFGKIIDLFRKLAGSNREWWGQQLAELLRRKPEFRSSILRYLGRVITPASDKPFVVRDEFKLLKDGGICAFVSNEFWQEFGDVVEEPTTKPQTMHIFQLLKNVGDLPTAKCRTAIIPELGGKNKVPTTLRELNHQMSLSENQQRGVWFLAYALNSSGVLRAVRVGWDGGGWDVRARSVGNPFRWGDGYQVFSRNSCA